MDRDIELDRLLDRASKAALESLDAKGNVLLERWLTDVSQRQRRHGDDC